MRSLEERFWSKVDQNGPLMPGMTTCCWSWIAARIPEGYGSFRLPGRHQVGAHRVSWMLHNRLEEASELCVLHRCDNRTCVRPEHLFLGTKGDNIRDAKSKGRNARGEKHGRAKLTQALVVEIRHRRDLGESGKLLAQAFGISDVMVYKIAKRQAWAHVEG